MEKEKRPRSALRIIVIIFVSLAVVLTLLGGIGTSCVAFGAEKYGPSMAKLVPVKGIFQALVFLSVLAGIYGLLSTIRLAKGKAGSVKAVILFLIAGAITSGIQFYYSATLRGSTAPNNFRLYGTLLALAIMLLMLIPGIKEKAGFESGEKKDTSNIGGAALLVSGLVILTTTIWAAPTHIIDGYNTANELFWPLIVAGTGCIITGGVLFVRRKVKQAVAETARLTVDEERA